MGDRIEKVLRTLSAKQRVQLVAMIEAIIEGRMDGMDVKKLKGCADAYRVRKGDFRIIFTIIKGGVRIIALERRSESTYGKL
jgi:mRNA-degrading endonuclease RelE of RelBE toxin-antitoxin system